MRRLTCGEFFAGIACALSLQGVACIREEEAHQAFAGIFRLFQEEAKERRVYGLFRINPDPLHGISPTVADGFLHLLHVGLAYRETPSRGLLHVVVGREEARNILYDLPGGEEFFLRLACEGIERYERAFVPKLPTGKFIPNRY